MLLPRGARANYRVFDTFPWPQTPTNRQIAEVAAAAVALRALRREIMGKLGYSLRELYRTLEEPGANPLRDTHACLDTAVRAAYGMEGDAPSSPKRRGTDSAVPSTDPLAFLLELNLALAAKEKAGKSITLPGFPLPPNESPAFTTIDAITVGLAGSPKATRFTF